MKAHLISTPLSTNKHLVRWVEKMADLTKPEAVHWVDGSKEEYDALCAQMVAGGTFIRLNRDLWPGCYLARSDNVKWEFGRTSQSWFNHSRDDEVVMSQNMKSEPVTRRGVFGLFGLAGRAPNFTARSSTTPVNPATDRMCDLAHFSGAVGVPISRHAANRRLPCFRYIRKIAGPRGMPSTRRECRVVLSRIVARLPDTRLPGSLRFCSLSSR